MQFFTETGSQYEVSLESKRIRRLAGMLDPTKNQGKDQEWRGYEEISEIKRGKRVLIFWGTELEGDLIWFRRTQTSRVTEVLQ